MTAFTAVVMSFNRGRFLGHCIASIEHHAPMAEVLVIDDPSEDPDTIAALGRIRRRWPVAQPECVRLDNPKVGGSTPTCSSRWSRFPMGG